VNYSKKTGILGAAGARRWSPVGDDTRKRGGLGQTAIADEHRRQILNYLRMTGCPLGLLVNFGAYPKVAIERFAL